VIRFDLNLAKAHCSTIYAGEAVVHLACVAVTEHLAAIQEKCDKNHMHFLTCPFSA